MEGGGVGMKICIIAHYFLPHVGGIEIVVYNQAKELAKRGHEVVIISSRTGKEPKEELMDGFKIKRVKIVNIFEKKWGIPYPVFFPKIYRIIKKEVKNADVVYVHDVFYLSSFVGSVYAEKYKKPLILMQHIKKVNDRRKIVNIVQDLVYKTYSQKILSNCQKIIFCNKEVMNWVNHLDKSLFFENCVDTSLFKPIKNLVEKEKIRKKYKLPLNKKVIIFVGRLFEKKGFQKLFEARSKDYFILFVGNGIVPEHMKKDKDVKFLSAKPQKDLARLYQCSDIFCLPSINEGFPLTILEAMASGLPVITSNNPGYDDYLDKNFTILIEPSVERIKNSISLILNDKKKLSEMAKWSRQQVEKRFNWKVNVDKLENIFKEVLT
jgi:glycosyltransferase involved in cell wall biosynthesis